MLNVTNLVLSTVLSATTTGQASQTQTQTQTQTQAQTAREGTTSTASDSRRPLRDRIGGFVGLEWRALGLGGHLSHGPGFQAGATLFDHLAIGIAGFARPGPINPRTFTLRLPEGETYRGQSEIDLRSDGTVLGVLVAPYHDFRRVPLSIELPVMVGYGGFGFYLHDEDRDVPDDRRVSDWENDLLDGQDSDASNLVIDVGLRLAIAPRRAPHVRPFVGAHYTWVLGYGTAMLDRYDGVSGVVGVKFGKFTRRR